MARVVSAAEEIDGLGHEGLAGAIVRNLDELQTGSVVAIQAPWGRGKTDLLKRVRLLCEQRVGEGDPARPLWVNPWEYGTPNLIAPVITELVERLEPEQKTERLKNASRTLLRAGNAVAFKALSVFVPFGELASGAQQPVDELIEHLFDPNAEAEQMDADPVAAMAHRFCELVDEFLTVTGSPGPLVICVDDLDRCLPDRQIAMLEAIHFLTSAGANAVFVIAIDPRLVQQAAISHYSGSAFDVEQYLNKMFDLRVNLTALAGTVRNEFVRVLVGSGNAADRLGIGSAELVGIWGGVFLLPELSNPRLMSRAAGRLELYLAADPDPLWLPESEDAPEVAAEDRVRSLVRLITVAERWPDLRLLLQALNSGSLREAFDEFKAFYGVPGEMSEQALAELRSKFSEDLWVFDRLPSRKAHPDLGLFLADWDLDHAAITFPAFDAKLRAAGL